MASTLFRNGLLFDGLSEEARAGFEVLVEDDRIAAVSDRIATLRGERR